MLNQSPAKQASLFQFADSGALVKRVVANSFDGIENGEAAPAEHFQINAEALIHHFCERQTFCKQGTRASDQMLHQANVAVIKAAFDDIVFGEAMRCGSIKRNVDAAFVQVARNILPEIGKLQGSAGSVGKPLARFIAIAAEIEDQAADGISRIDAVGENRVPIRTTLRSLVLAKCLEQIGERLLGNVFGDNRLA